MRTLHKFENWDKIDDDIKQFRRQSDLSVDFEITAWAFADHGLYPPVFWHETGKEELCYLPAGVWIVCLSDVKSDDFFQVDFWTDISTGAVE